MWRRCLKLVNGRFTTNCKRIHSEEQRVAIADQAKQIATEEEELKRELVALAEKHGVADAKGVKTQKSILGMVDSIESTTRKETKTVAKLTEEEKKRLTAIKQRSRDLKDQKKDLDKTNDTVKKTVKSEKEMGTTFQNAAQNARELADTVTKKAEEGAAITEDLAKKLGIPEETLIAIKTLIQDIFGIQTEINGALAESQQYEAALAQLQVQHSTSMTTMWQQKKET